MQNKNHNIKICNYNNYIYILELITKIMFRKVTKTGPATLTAALPAKWVKKQRIKAGDEIEINEIDNKLIIQTINQQEEKEIELQYNQILFEDMLKKLFLEGYDIITINNSTNKNKLKEIIKKFPGLQIIEEQNNKTIISRTLKSNLSSTKAILRRCYLLLKESMENNPTIISEELSRLLFLIQLQENKTTEITILEELINTLKKIKKPIYDDAHATIRNIINKIYEQKYSFEYNKTRELLRLFEKEEELFKVYFKKDKNTKNISKINHCFLLLKQLHKELLQKQSIEMLETKTKKENNKQFKVGICLKNQSNKFWSLDVKESMELTTMKYKNIEFEFNSPLTSFDVKEQEKILNKFIEEKVDGIILALIEPKSMNKTLKKITKEKIPLLIIDTDLDQEGISYNFIGFNNYKGGKLTAKYLKTKLKKPSKILIIKGRKEGNFNERVTGFIDTIGNKHETTVIRGEFVESIAYEKTLEHIKKHKTDAIFATSTNMALGASKATKELNIKIPICSFDKTKEGEAALKNGEFLSTIDTKPKELGILSIQTMNDLLKGKTVAKRLEYDIELITSKDIKTEEK